MCGTGYSREHGRFGFLVDTPEIRALIDETRRQMAEVSDPADRVEALKPAFAQLLAADGWLPEALARPDAASRMGDGIGQYALYRAEDGSLCLFSLVVPANAATPVHDHLAWGLVGVYRGEQSLSLLLGALHENLLRLIRRQEPSERLAPSTEPRSVLRRTVFAADRAWSCPARAR